MVTYPSTHGVFETTIREICEIVHAHGGQVYMDGANMNAQVGLCRPGDIGADVCHLNLHKTSASRTAAAARAWARSAWRKHLVPFLPGLPILNQKPATAITQSARSRPRLTAAPASSPFRGCTSA